MNKLGFKNFFNKYIFEPKAPELSKKDQNKALFASIVGGVLTLGALHLFTAATNLIRFNGKVTKGPKDIKFNDTIQNLFTESVPNSAKSELENPKIVKKVNEEKIRKELQKRNIQEHDINITIAIINEIISSSTVLGRPLIYSETGVAYIRKNENGIPLTIEAHKEGGTYIHFKSSKKAKDMISSACQKRVYRAINEEGEIVAASVIHDPKAYYNKKTFDNESKAHSLFNDCPYVIRVHALSVYEMTPKSKQYSNDEAKYGLIAEYCNGITDGKFFQTLTPKEQIEFFLKILKGAEAIHKKGYCHFDFKSDNVLYKEVDGVKEPRIIDFGVIQPMGPTTEAGFLRGAFHPPEIGIDSRDIFNVTEKVDVWKLGMYSAITLLGITPEIEWGEVHYNNKNNWFYEPTLKASWVKVNPEMERLTPIVMQMLEIDPDKRISMRDAIQKMQELLTAL